MKESINIEMSTSVRRDSARNLNLMIKSQDIHNSMFLLNFRDGKGDPIELGDDFTVEVLSVFKESKSEALTEATIYGNYAHWEFDTRFIHGKDTVFNYVYVKKDGVPVVSADANAFYFAVDLSKIDEGAERVAEYYDKNYEKVLHEFEVAINLTKDEWIEMSQDAKAFVDEIKDKTVDEFVETKMGEELANLEVNYATRLTGLESNDSLLTAQLAQKIGDGKKAELEDLSPNVLSAIEGGEGSSFNLLSVPQDDSVTSKKISPEGLSPETINGTLKIRTVNHFNKNAVTTGGFFQGGNGVWVNNGAWCSSDFIPVEAGQIWQTNLGSNVTCWNAEKTFMQGLNGTTFTIPTNVKFIKVATQVTNLNIIIVALQTQFPTTYVPYYKYGLGDLWDIGSNLRIENDNIPSLVKKRTVNLFNKNDVEDGGYYEISGIWRAFGGWVSSKPIEIMQGKTYKKTDTYSSTFWDENLNFVSSELHTEIVPAPKGAKYVRVAVRKTVLDEFMLTELDKFPSYYVPYTQYETDKTWNVPSKTAIYAKLDKIEAENKQRDVLYSSDHTAPIDMYLPDFSGHNRPYHPSGVYITGGFNGFKYWLAQTPIPKTALPYTERFEVPVIYKSNNGIDWQVVANPLDDLTPAEIADTDYMSDPHMVYRPDTNTLEVWYRLTRRSTGGTTIFRKTTQNGEDWTPRETLLSEKLMTSPYYVQSPAVIWDDVRKIYKVWYFTNSSNTNYIEVGENLVWDTSKQQKVNFSDTTIYHHIDVNYFNGVYHFLGYHSGAFHKVSHYTSDDGISFTFNRDILTTKDGNPMYSNGLYRSISLLGENNKVMIYFSYMNSSNFRGVGLVTAESFDDFQLVKSISSDKILVDKNLTLSDLYDEVVRLRGLIEQ